MKKSKALLVVVGLTFVVLTAAFLVFMPSGKEVSLLKVTMTNNKIEPRFSVTSDKDGFIGSYFGTENEITLSDGKHRLSIEAPGYENIILDIDTSNGKKIDFTFKNESINSASKELFGSNQEVLRERYFAENTWLVADIQYSSGSSDTETSVYKKVGDQWKPVSQGTSIDIDYLVSIGAPLDLIRYIEGQ